jgi:hypothetical protein
MEQLKFDTSITAKIFHSAKRSLYEYVGANIPEWGRLSYEELNATVERVELSLKGKSSLPEEPSDVHNIEEKLLKAIISVLLEQEAKPTTEKPKEEAEKKAPASKKKK